MGRNQELDWGKALYNKKAILLLFFFSKEFFWVFLTYHHNFLCIIIIHILSGLGLFFLRFVKDLSYKLRKNLGSKNISQMI